MVIAGDMNARVGNTPVEGVVGSVGEYTLHSNGQILNECNI